MPQIVLTDDQLRAVQAATDVIAIRDQNGKLVGYVSPPPDDARIAEAKRRLQSQGPWYSTRQVLDHLNSLGQE